MSDLSGRITFYDFLEPPLESGEYTVSIEQRVQGGSDAKNQFDETFANQLTFAVQGVRFSIPPDYVYGVYPPPGQQGEYATVLPHIVFNIRTLPWQRNPGSVHAYDDVTVLYPWLALLTFDVNDPIPELQSGTLADLLTLPPNVVSYPDLALETGEKAEDPVNYIDIPGALWNAIAPSRDDLRWLAHARRIDAERLARKAFVNDVPPSAEYSSVVANRFPAEGNRTVCYLVSVENLAAYLHGAGTIDPANSLRLAVLSSWSFGAVQIDQTFAEIVRGLDHAPGTPQIPYANRLRSSNARVVDALAMAYTAIDHETRQGATTVSWYRGPLLPYENRIDIEVPLGSADALIRYEPTTGMFDTSLAAAWQLGRLLALADQDYATTLYNWKRGQQQQAVIEFERDVLERELGVELAGIQPLHMQMMQSVIKPILKEFTASPGTRDNRPPATGSPSFRRWTRRGDYVAGLARALQRPYALEDEDPAAKAILEWLTRLSVFHGVPLQYLVADRRMLPENAIRFFRIDPNWVAALVDGAFSLGRVTTGDGAREGNALAAFAERARGHARKLRPRILARRFGTPPPPQELLDAPDAMSGFLLRSSAIAAWPGLEVRVYDAQGTKLDLLRFERLGRDVLFCIAAGVVHKLSLSEPAESLHFGISLETEEKRLKYVDASSGHEPGQQMDVSVPVSWRDGTRRVLEADGMQQVVYDALIANGGIDPDGDWTPAQFALEMVQGVQEVDFRIELPIVNVTEPRA